VFGPVPSRRLGRSLGIDPISFKTCTYDCVYCQLGRTTHKTLARAPYVAASAIISELESWLDSGATADVITLSGSGEPTLNSEIGEIIGWLKKHATVPIALLTNGSLLFQDEVRKAIRLVDLLLPSLDAGTPDAFEKINRPCAGLDLGLVVEGLMAARRECAAPIWLEVMLVAGFNDSVEEIGAIRRTIDRVQPDRVQINTVVRPPAERCAGAVSRETLAVAREAFGQTAEIIVFAPQTEAARVSDCQLSERMMSLLARRPCTLSDIAVGLSVHRNEAAKYVGRLLAAGAIRPIRYGSEVYYVPSAQLTPQQKKTKREVFWSSFGYR
jgi:wyosine [tRNA(Phe)-imidazoG37] synthetase (radical SAM superfamily)